MKESWRELLREWVLALSAAISLIFSIFGALLSVIIVIAWFKQTGRLFEIYPHAGFAHFYQYSGLGMCLVMLAVGLGGLYFLYWRPPTQKKKPYHRLLMV